MNCTTLIKKKKNDYFKNVYYGIRTLTKRGKEIDSEE